jgi:hypothetical protein
MDIEKIQRDKEILSELLDAYHDCMKGKNEFTYSRIFEEQYSELIWEALFSVAKIDVEQIDNTLIVSCETHVNIINVYFDLNPEFWIKTESIEGEFTKELVNYKKLDLKVFPTAYVIAFNLSVNFNQYLKSKPNEQNSDVGYVYCIANANKTAIKIGWTKNPEKRVKDLQTGNSEKLTILHYIPGSKYLEKSLHIKYKMYQTSAKNEWFEYNEDIINYFKLNQK